MYRGGDDPLKRKRLVAVLLGLMIAGACFAYFVSGESLSDQTITAEIDDGVITVRELEAELNEQRASVIDYFRQTYGAAYDDGFWRSEAYGEVPEQVAKQRALEVSLRRKVELMLAEEHGFIQGSDYEAVMEERERENRRRQAAVQAGEPVYGPVTLDEAEYMNYLISRLRIELREKLADRELVVTEEELAEQFEEMKLSLQTEHAYLRFKRIAVSYRNTDEVPETLKEQIEQALEMIKERLERGQLIEELVEEVQKVDGALEIEHVEEKFDEQTARDLFRSHAALYEWLAGERRPGQVSPVFDNERQGHYVMAHILESEDVQAGSLEEHRGVVREELLKKKYDANVDQRLEAANITLHQDMLDRVKIH